MIASRFCRTFAGLLCGLTVWTASAAPVAAQSKKKNGTPPANPNPQQQLQHQLKKDQNYLQQDQQLIFQQQMLIGQLEMMNQLGLMQNWFQQQSLQQLWNQRTAPTAPQVAPQRAATTPQRAATTPQTAPKAAAAPAETVSLKYPPSPQVRYSEPAGLPRRFGVPHLRAWLIPPGRLAPYAVLVRPFRPNTRMQPCPRHSPNVGARQSCWR